MSGGGGEGGGDRDVLGEGFAVGGGVTWLGGYTGLLVRMCDGCVCVCRLKAPPCVIEEGRGGGT